MELRLGSGNKRKVYPTNWKNGVRCNAKAMPNQSTVQVDGVILVIVLIE